MPVPSGPGSLFSSRLSSSTSHAVVPAQLSLELRQIGAMTDAHVLDAENASQIFELLARHGLTEQGVMCAAREQPSLAAALEVGTRNPKRTRHRQLRHRSFDFHDVDLLNDEPHSPAHVDE